MYLGRIVELWGPREPGASACASGPLAGSNPDFMRAALLEYHLHDPTDPTSPPYSYVKATSFESGCDRDGADPANVKVAWSFVDGLGRVRMTVGEGDDPATALPGQRPWIASGYKTFDAKGAVRATYDPAYIDFEPGAAALPPPVQAQCAPTDERLPVDTVCTSTTRYDAFGRKVSVTLPDGTESRVEYRGPLETWAYDGNDTDPSSPFFGTPGVSRKDGHGRVIETVVTNVTLSHADGSEQSRQEIHTRFGYTPLGGLESLRTCKTGAAWDPGSSGGCAPEDRIEKVQVFDSIGQRVRIEDPDAGTWEFRFDDAGNLIESTDGRWHAAGGDGTDGSKIAYTYDAANRLVAEVCIQCVLKPPGTVLVRYHYDSPAALKGGRGYMDLTDDPAADEPQDWVLGRLSLIEDETGWVMFSYDRLGRQVTEAQHVEAMLLDDPDPAARTVITGTQEVYIGRVRYDDAGRVRALVYPDEDGPGGEAPLEVQHEYDRRGLLVRIHGPDPLTGEADHTYLEGVTYNARGQRVRYHYGDASGITHQMWYDRLGRLKEKKVSQTVAVDPGNRPAFDLHWRHFTYDRASNITHIQDLRDYEHVDAYTSGQNLPYDLDIQHDGLYRVTRVRYQRKPAELAAHPERLPLRREMRYAYSPIGNLVQRSTTDGSGVENPAGEFYEKWLNTDALVDPIEPPEPPDSPQAHPHAFGSATPDPGVREVHATYDANGNMTELTVLNTDAGGGGGAGAPAGRRDRFVYTWDHYDRLVSVARYNDAPGPGGEPPSPAPVAQAYFAYDSGGQRVVKSEQVLAPLAGAGRSGSTLPPDPTPRDTLYVTEGFELRNRHLEQYVFDGRRRLARIGVAAPSAASSFMPFPGGPTPGQGSASSQTPLCQDSCRFRKAIWLPGWLVGVCLCLPGASGCLQPAWKRLEAFNRVKIPHRGWSWREPGPGPGMGD